ncbi:MAG: peptidoglycan bridge formation glycyltransferase FemA/FemB family protein, partial [Terriglobia bacterium]
MDPSFSVIHSFPPPTLEARWREFLVGAEAPSQYNAPEFFLEPYWEGKRPFAVLALEGDRVTGVLTGIHEGNQVLSGLGVRPQIFIGNPENSAAALRSLAAGMLSEAGSDPLLTVYTWEWLPLKPLQKYGFRPRALTGDVVLDLTKGTEQLFKELDKKRRNNIRYATKHGVEVSRATTIEEFRTYYQIYLGWCKRKNLAPFPQEMEEKAFLQCSRNRLLY